MNQNDEIAELEKWLAVNVMGWKSVCPSTYGLRKDWGTLYETGDPDNPTHANFSPTREGSPDALALLKKCGEKCTDNGNLLTLDKCPEDLRSIKGLVRKRDGRKGKKGTTYSANTIDDMVKWSMTLRGGKQHGFDFMYDDSPIFDIDDAHEPCKSGYCE